MNRNTMAKFNEMPSVNLPRSKFNLDHSLKTSFNVGDLVPILCQEVLPGSTVELKTSKVVRLQTLVTPIMDNLNLDLYYFFVPNRIVWNHWVNLMGENTLTSWYPTTEYEVPQITSPSGGWNVGTIADYLGIPTGISNLSVSALPFRAYAKIVQDYFRDQNLTDPLVIPDGDSTVVGVNSGTDTTDVAKGGLPFKACKTHDFFSSCLPDPQKGEAVTLPLLNDGIAPVFTSSTINDYYSRDTVGDYYDDLKDASPLYFDCVDNEVAGALSPEPFTFDGTVFKSDTNRPYRISTATLGVGNPAGSILKSEINGASPYVGEQTLGDLTSSITPVNLVAQISPAMATINQLREAFQIQKLLEKDARSGSRYQEILLGHFSCAALDARLQRAEYLGGKHIPFNIAQVKQTSSSTNDDQYLGDVAGMSVTADVEFDFKKSFTEHGYIIGLAVARYDHTYQQGIPLHFLRKGRFDFYWPVLANIGEQPVPNAAIYAQGTDTDKETFGFQEAWAEYRYMPNRITGQMRSSYSASLDVWHLGDDYSSLPVLSDSWIREDKSNVDRVLEVTSAVSNQVFGDFYFDDKVIAPMPAFSIPGLIDHW